RVIGADNNDEAFVGDLAFGLSTPLREMWSRERSMGAARSLMDELAVVVPAGPTGEAYVRSVADTLVDLEAPSALLQGDGPSSETVSYTLTGMPLLNRGLSRSVTSNQWKSLGFALLVVFVIMVLLFRSLSAGMLASIPTVLTLLVVYGGMGVLDIHLDIGTSMLASLIIGAGVDYGVHLLSAWHVPPGGTLADGSARTVTLTGPAIVTNALTVAAGFFVLTLGDARPLQNVGGLTAIAMGTAAIATFVAIPALARQASYGRAQDPVQQALGEVGLVDEAPPPTLP
ncbi:MAG: MMPL family transporter, partial [Myxococcota bacterium]|nr:MMPL family transporter [Myxococcota bacterium]